MQRILVVSFLLVTGVLPAARAQAPATEDLRALGIRSRGFR
jgi:hypothetical protein